MVNRRNTSYLISALMILALASSPAAWGEVSAELDIHGKYFKTSVLANSSDKNVKIWKIQRQKDSIIPLNPDGDSSGDLWPVIAENPLLENYPTVVWSAFNGNDFDLAWSKWDGTGWTAISWVEKKYSSLDDLDPDLALDLSDGGRPYLCWWRDSYGTGEIYMSIFLHSAWMAPFLVSDPGTDSRYPEISVLEDGMIEIMYEDPEGPETRYVVFNHPATITDDLDPLEYVFFAPGENPDIAQEKNR